jgi:hypothetical protein
MIAFSSSTADLNIRWNLIAKENRNIGDIGLTLNNETQVYLTGAEALEIIEALTLAATALAVEGAE